MIELETNQSIKNKNDMALFKLIQFIDRLLCMNEIDLTLKKFEVINKLIKDKCSFVRFLLKRNIMYIGEKLFKHG